MVCLGLGALSIIVYENWVYSCAAGHRLLTLDAAGGVFIHGCRWATPDAREAGGLRHRKGAAPASGAPLSPSGDDADLLRFPSLTDLFPGNEGASLPAEPC